MKLNLIVILACCAFAAASSDIFEDVPRVGHVQYELVRTESLADAGLAESINNFIQQSVDDFNESIDKFNSFSDETQVEVNGVIDSARNKIEEAFKKIMDKINELKRKGGIYRACAEKYELELKEARKSALLALKECALGIGKALKDFAVQVGAEALKLSKNVLHLAGMVKECYDKDGALAIAKCAFQKIKEVKEVVGKIVAGVKDTIAAIKENTQKIVASAKDCNENYIKVTLAKFKEHREKVDECYKNEVFY